MSMEGVYIQDIVGYHWSNETNRFCEQFINDIDNFKTVNL